MPQIGTKSAITRASVTRNRLLARDARALSASSGHPVWRMGRSTPGATGTRRVLPLAGLVLGHPLLAARRLAAAPRSRAPHPPGRAGAPQLRHFAGGCSSASWDCALSLIIASAVGTLLRVGDSTPASHRQTGGQRRPGALAIVAAGGPAAVANGGRGHTPPHEELHAHAWPATKPRVLPEIRCGRCRRRGAGPFPVEGTTR